MERKITVLSNKGTNTVVFNSTANTLGELKAEMMAQGISYEGMSIFEGISKTELMADDSQLPKDLSYKGTVTNDLVILLSVKDKKITSGMDRSEIYEIIKSQGLQDAVITKYGRNFTQVSSADLMTVIAENAPSDDAEEVAVCPPPTEADNVVEAFNMLLSVLNNDGTLEDEDYASIYDTLNGSIPVAETPKMESPYSEEETEEMFDFLK